MMYQYFHFDSALLLQLQAEADEQEEGESAYSESTRNYKVLPRLHRWGGQSATKPTPTKLLMGNTWYPLPT